MIDSSLLLHPLDCMKRRVEQTSALQSEPVAKMIESLANGVASWSRCCYLYQCSNNDTSWIICSSCCACLLVPRAFFSVEVSEGNSKNAHDPRPMYKMREEGSCCLPVASKNEVRSVVKSIIICSLACSSYSNLCLLGQLSPVIVLLH